MLVRAFEVEVRQAAIRGIGSRIVEVIAVRAPDHGPVRGAGVEPDVERIAVLLVDGGLIA
ncbi:hypothetical protein D3C86_1732470 [compost metagenome]